MNTGLEFGVEHFHYGAMLGETGLAGEVRGRDPDAKMRLSTFAPASVPLMS